MVEAGEPENSDATFAARPVGASVTDLMLNDARLFIKAAMTDVFPVPANPFSTNALRGSLQKTNFDKASISPFCSGSGLKVRFAMQSSMRLAWSAIWCVIVQS